MDKGNYGRLVPSFAVYTSLPLSPSNAYDVGGDEPNQDVHDGSSGGAAELGLSDVPHHPAGETQSS